VAASVADADPAEAGEAGSELEASRR